MFRCETVFGAGPARGHKHMKVCVWFSARRRQILVTSRVTAVRETTLHEGHSSVLGSTIIQKIMAKSLTGSVVIKTMLLTCADAERLIVTPRANFFSLISMCQRRHEAMTPRCSTRVGM